MLGLICQLPAQRIIHPIRKPRNNADDAIAPETRRDGAHLPTARAICFVAPLARGPCQALRVASRISSRKASVTAARTSSEALTKANGAGPFRAPRRAFAKK